MGQRVHLNRALSKMGLGSRTQAKKWIEAGQVEVNGITILDPEMWVDLKDDTIKKKSLPNEEENENGKKDSPKSIGNVIDTPQEPLKKIYLAMYKPVGYVTTRSDELNRQTVYDLLPSEWQNKWIFPIGRLDKDSEGLLLFTNDSAFSNRLTDPAHAIAKTYHVQLDKKPLANDLQTLSEGLVIAGVKTRPAQFSALEGKWAEVILQEGRNRQIRKSFHELGYKVKRLIRKSIGGVTLEGLELGKCRVLDQKEIHRFNY